MEHLKTNNEEECQIVILPEQRPGFFLQESYNIRIQGVVCWDAPRYFIQKYGIYTYEISRVLV